MYEQSPQMPVQLPDIAEEIYPLKYGDTVPHTWEQRPLILEISPFSPEQLPTNPEHLPNM
jgi:hypothetical protein